MTEALLPMLARPACPVCAWLWPGQGLCDITADGFVLVDCRFCGTLLRLHLATVSDDGVSEWKLAHHRADAPAADKSR